MSEQNISLEEIIGALEEFLVNTHDIGWFRDILKSMLFEFNYRGKGKQEPAKTFHQMKEELRDLENTEKELEAELSTGVA